MSDGLVTPEQQLLMQMALDKFLESSWPRIRWLQWTLDHDGAKDVDVSEQVDALPRDLGTIRSESQDGNSSEVLALTVKGCSLCKGAEPLLRTFLMLLRLCIDRYLSAEVGLLRSDDLAGLPDQALVRRAYRLLREEYIFLGGGGGSETSWQYEVSPAIRYFRDVQTLDQYIERRRWYLAEPRPRRVRAARPAIPTLANADDSQPAEIFSFIKSEHLRKLAQRDYAELLQATTTKARTVLAGAVVESMLLDRLTQNDEAVSPDLLGLALGRLYEKARAEGVVSDRGALVVSAMRDFRNLGHPGAELREGPLTEHEADIAVSLMRMLISEFKSMSTT